VPAAQRHGAPAWQIWTALGILYVVWGSTYLGIRVLVETVPPLISTGARFCCASALLLAWLLARGGREAVRVTRGELRGALLVGTLLIGGTGLVAVAEERGAPSSYAALIFASIPLWVVLLRRLTGEHPPAQTYLGVAAGYVGVALLLLPGERPAGVDVVAAVMLVVAALSWSVGSVASRHVPAPASAPLATVLTTGAGGLAMLLAGTIDGEWAQMDWGAVSGRSAAAFAYLVLIGSIVGFSAFVWALHHAPISQVATYAYVNPVVALILGRIFFTEPVSALALAGAAVIVASVAFVVRHEADPVEPEVEADR
jgi:drug/metabolite transporter (DMT)-like permease